MKTQERLDSLWEQYQATGSKIVVADENGLFSGERSEERQKIEAAISALEVSLAAANPGRAEADLFRLQGVFYATLNSAGLGWRLVHVYGVLHIVWSFVGALAAGNLAVLVMGVEDSPPIAVLWAGIAGGAFKGVYYTIDKANHELLRRAWLVSALAGPFIGLFLAILLYYAFAGGLAIFSANGSPVEINHNALIWVSLFAGFTWEWAMAKCNKLAESI